MEQIQKGVKHMRPEGLGKERPYYTCMSLLASNTADNMLENSYGKVISSFFFDPVIFYKMKLAFSLEEDKICSATYLVRLCSESNVRNLAEQH